ncbi:hypothetical protein [Metabacillus sp. SLBN-84]
MSFLVPFRPTGVPLSVPKTDASEPDPYIQDHEAEYVHMSLWNNEAARFNRIWSGYRFTDDEVALLMAGYEIRIKTAYTDGIVGSLEWQEYGGHEYFGFAPWDAASYEQKDAPFPLQWNGHVFTGEEQEMLRSGERLLLVCESNRSQAAYAVNVSFGFIPENGPYPSRWGIIPHFEQFGEEAEQFTRTTCVFLPVFSGERLSHSEISRLRDGGSISFNGISRNGKPYRCELSLELDRASGRWRLTPDFHRENRR